MCIRLNLRKIARIQIGYQHREKLDLQADGTYNIVQIKDISSEGTIIKEGLASVSTRRKPNKYFVNKGDVIFLSRGQRVFAIPIEENFKETLAAYYFYIIRLRVKDVLPEYLAWFINQSPTQKFLESQMHGSQMKMVLKTTFNSLQIDVPPISVQQTIVNLDKLKKREELCQRNILEMRGKLIAALSIDAAKRKQPNIGKTSE